ncbi:hypothetical protein C0992_008531 [Termitomyces sp. T32_za158]|nr:hypothetical protein C0992_008531 [Termitomyces sp. T32_za158]
MLVDLQKPLHMRQYPTIFKIGSNLEGDITRIKKQFTELLAMTSFNIIELKEYCVQRGIIKRGASGSLDVLVEKALGMYLSKDDTLRKSEEWEAKDLCTDLLQYAALDVYASRMVFSKVSELAPLETVSSTTAPSTKVGLSMHDGDNED